MKFRIVHYLWILLLLSVVACQSYTKKTVRYVQPAFLSRNKQCMWLSKDENYKKSTYDKVFYRFFKHCLLTEQYQLANDALEIVCNMKYGYRNYDPKFIQTVQHFYRYYRHRFPNYRINYIHNYLGDFYVDEGNYSKALRWYKKSLLSTVVDYRSCTELAYAYFNIAYCYHSTGQQDLALKSNRLAEKYYRMTDCINCLENVESNYAIIYLATNNYNEAIRHNQQALDLCNNNKDSIDVFYNLQDKIAIYTQLKHPRLAQLTDSTYRLFRQYRLDEPTVQTTIFTLYTRQLLEQGRIQEAETVLNELEPIVDSISSTNSTQQLLVAKSELSIAKNNDNIDHKLITRTLSYLKQNKDYNKIIDFCTVLKNQAILRKNYREALKYEQEIRDAEDRLASIHVQNRIIELDKKYQVAEQKRLLLVSSRNISKQHLTIVILVGSLLLLILGILSYLALQGKKKLKKEQWFATLFTKKIIETSEEERKRIATDLHDSIGHELLSLKSLVQHSKEDAIDKIDTIINDVRIISRNLHPVLFEKIGLTASLEQLIERTQTVNQFMVTAEIQYSGSLSTTDELHVYRIVQEALSNILKYSGAAAAKITVEERRSFIWLEIKDNGKGFAIDKALMQGTSSGLANISERSKVLGSEVKIISSEQGTTLTLFIPKKL